MRVALLTDSIAFAGTERHILDLAIGLRDRNVDVALACPEPSALGVHLAAHQLRQIAMQKGGIYDRAAIRMLADRLRRGELDVLHSHNGRTALIAAHAVRAARRGACVATQHFICPNHTSHRGLKKIVSSAMHAWVDRRTQGHVAISEAVRVAALERNPKRSHVIHVVPNGIVDPMLHSRRGDEDVRSEMGIDRASPMIVCTARLEAEKNVGDLINAMQVVVKATPCAICVLVGDGSLRSNLEQLVNDRGLKNSVRFTGFRADALSLIGAADVFVLPSVAEPFGLVILEAMALRRPVIAVNAGGPPEIVMNGETGWLTPPSDANAMANAVIRLLENPLERKSMGEKGRARFESRYTESRMAADMIKVYSTLLPG